MPLAHAHSRHNAWNEEEVLDAIHANPVTSICWFTYEIGLSQNSVWCTLHDECLYPFHIQEQWLQPGDSNLPLQIY
jgi:hypothetical protein